VILIPASMFIFFYAQEIITFIFQYGSFGEDSTSATYPLLQILSLTVFGLAMNTYITRFFYALENTILPIILAVISIFGINILVIKFLLADYGAGALAWGTAISTIVNVLLLILFGKTRLKLVPGSWKLLSGLVLFALLSVYLFWLVSLLPAVNVFASLLAGGFVTAVLIGLGMKCFR